MSDSAIYTVIMAGGIGSRFWPQSTPKRPKQFLDILQEGVSMIRSTVQRVQAFCPARNVYVVTSSAYAPLVQEELPELTQDQILGEPCMRNTAPCIAYAVWKISKIHPSATILVLPSDSYIPDTDLFVANMNSGLRYVNENPVIMTLGIKPSAPETGYGYIEAGKPVQTNEAVFAVNAFREKPALDLAREYVEAGNFYWNAGMFMATVPTFKEAFKAYLPDVAATFDAGNELYHTDSEQAFVDQIYPGCANISVDYGIMEKAQNIVVQQASFRWSDLGAWNALHELQDKDNAGNTLFAGKKGNRDVVYENVSNCLVSLPDNYQAVIQGVSDLIIVQADNRLLICKKENEQDIKAYVAKLTNR